MCSLWVGLGSLCVCFGLAGVRFGFAFGVALGSPGFASGSLSLRLGSLRVRFGLALAPFGVRCQQIKNQGFVKAAWA